jgi:hypothetical protein
MHVAYPSKHHPTTKEHLDILFASFRAILDEHIDSGRIYLVINMANLIIEPELKTDYAAHAREISDKYLMPGGVARYGYQITRITVRVGYNEYLSEDPNIFDSRQEAYDYIYSLIEKDKTVSPVQSPL